MELIEDASIPDVFVSGIAKIERMEGGTIRMSYYAERRNERGETAHYLVLRVVRTLESLTQSMKLTAAFLAQPDTPMVAEGGIIRPLDS